MKQRCAVLRAMVVLVGTLSAAFAQQPANPTFRAAINYVELPVRVLDGKGNFVRDLGTPDFQILEDGKRQTIADFALVDLPLSSRAVPARPSATAGGTSTPVAPSPVPAAPSADGRMYLLVLDDAHVRPQYFSQVKRLTTSFVRDYMSEDDVAAVLFTSGIKGQDFTGDRRLLLAAIEGFVGRFDGDISRQSTVQKSISRLGAPIDEELVSRATLKTIDDVSRAMATLKQRRKAVVFVSATMGCVVSRQVRPDRPVPRRDSLGNPASEGESGTSSPPALCGETIWNTVRAAIQSDVSVYAIDPRGVQDPTWVSPRIDGRGGPGRATDKMEMVEGGLPSIFDGMRVLADSTGGFVVANVNGFDKAFDRIVRENSTYYLIGYYSTNERADGSTRKNQVKLTRKGMQVLYRATYLAPR